MNSRTDQQIVPVYMRIGDNPEQHIGDVWGPDPMALPDLLQQVTDHARKLAEHPELAEETQ